MKSSWEWLSGLRVEVQYMYGDSVDVQVISVAHDGLLVEAGDGRAFIPFHAVRMVKEQHERA